MTKFAIITVLGLFTGSGGALANGDAATAQFLALLGGMAVLGGLQIRGIGVSSTITARVEGLINEVRRDRAEGREARQAIANKANTNRESVAGVDSRVVKLEHDWENRKPYCPAVGSSRPVRGE